MGEKTTISLNEYRALVASGAVCSSVKSPRASRQRRSAQEEETLHRACAEWVFNSQARHPILQYLMHVPNGGKRSRGEAGKLKAMGVRKGVPDFVLPFPSERFTGLAVELKAGDGRLTDEQQKWLRFAAQNGYRTAVCFSLTEFIAVIQDFLAPDVSAH
jgi:hypothetical protein